jgi:NTP pyrophosphatase (non-canonical NTP hydrolase)
MSTTPPLTFDEFREANRARCLKWHPKGIDSWSDSDWMVAIMGELGELASLIKMKNRERDGLPGNKVPVNDGHLAKEAADVFTYLDLFCEKNGINLGLAAADKFNEISARVGFPDQMRMPGPVPATTADMDEDSPFWLVNCQIDGLREGLGSSEDHRDVINFFVRAGLTQENAEAAHRAICLAK